MDPFTLLVLVGLASLGAMTIAYVVAVIAYAVVFAGLLVLVVIITIAGIIGDYYYNRKMVRGEVPYRLPWYFRWKGWQIRHDPDIYYYKSGMFFDSRVNRIVCMVRLTDRAFSERCGLGLRD